MEQSPSEASQETPRIGVEVYYRVHNSPPHLLAAWFRSFESCSGQGCMSASFCGVLCCNRMRS
jgi:hypothetical protein